MADVPARYPVVDRRLISLVVLGSSESLTYSPHQLNGMLFLVIQLRALTKESISWAPHVEGRMGASGRAETGSRRTAGVGGPLVMIAIMAAANIHWMQEGLAQVRPFPTLLSQHP